MGQSDPITDENDGAFTFAPGAGGQTSYVLTPPAVPKHGRNRSGSWGDAVNAALDYLANPPCAIVKKSAVQTSAVQTLATGVGQDVTWDQEDEDNDVIHDNTTNNTRLTCKTAGLYAIWFSIKWGTDSSVGYRQVDLIHSVASYLGASMVPGGSNLRGAGNHLYVEKRMAVNEYVFLSAWHDQGSNLDIATSSRFGRRWLRL